MRVHKTHKLHLFHLPSVNPGTWRIWVKAQALPLRNLPASLVICSGNCSQHSVCKNPGPAHQNHPLGHLSSGLVLVVVLLLQNASSFCPEFLLRFLFFFLLFPHVWGLVSSMLWKGQIPRLTSKTKVFPITSVALFNKEIESLNSSPCEWSWNSSYPFLGFFL